MNLAVLSDGTIFENPHYFRKSIGRITQLQKSLSRKKKDSSNHRKAKIALAKAWRHVRSQRLDCAHKVSHNLAANYSIIVFEDLIIPRMVRIHNMAGAIMDAAWGQLRSFAAYKAERNGGHVIVVNPRGTSQECSQCHEVVPKDLSMRIHRCPRCGLVLDRDVNAAKNVLHRGLEHAHAEVKPQLVVPHRTISKFAPMKQEAPGFTRG